MTHITLYELNTTVQSVRTKLGTYFYSAVKLAKKKLQNACKWYTNGRILINRSINLPVYAQGYLAPLGYQISKLDVHL